MSKILAIDFMPQEIIHDMQIYRIVCPIHINISSMNLEVYLGLPTGLLYCSSAGKESPCNTGDPNSIPGSERSQGEGIGYQLQYSWATLVAQIVKNPRIHLQCGRPGFDPCLGRSIGEGKGYLLQYSGLENYMDCIPMGSQRVRHNWVTFPFTFQVRPHLQRTSKGSLTLADLLVTVETRRGGNWERKCRWISANPLPLLECSPECKPHWWQGRRIMFI